MNDQPNDQQQEQEHQEDRTMGAFALVGLVVVIILVAWLAIQAVRLIPDAFMSLASLADRVNNEPTPEVTLEVTSTQSVLNAGTAVLITWNDLEAPGTYSFEYDCAPGVSLDLEVDGGARIPLACERSYEFADGTFSVTAHFASERDRVAEVTYRIVFVPEDGMEAVVEDEKMLTITNADIPDETETETEVETEPEPDDETATTTAPETTPQPIQYRWVKTTTYSVPESDPNGYADLSVSYHSVGEVIGGTFVAESKLEAGEEGAIRFEVKNMGTKTSDEWEFTATLPSGERYESKTQDPLRPLERALVTVAFDSAGSEGAHQFEVEVTGGDDTNEGNNEFSWSVVVTD